MRDYIGAMQTEKIHIQSWIFSVTISRKKIGCLHNLL